MDAHGAHPRPPADRLDAGHQFGEGEGLDEIVVAPALQPADTFVDIGQGAQDKDRGPAAGLAQRRDDAQAVDVAGQHPIHDDRVVGLARGEKHAVASIVGVIDGMSRFGQAFSDEGRHALVILDQQDFHRTLGFRNWTA